MVLRKQHEEKQKQRKRDQNGRAEDEEGDAEGCNREAKDSFPLGRDPLEVLGREVMMLILSNLDARSVALSLLVSVDWYAVASSDLLWSLMCEDLWLGKAHLPRLSQDRCLSKLAAYSISMLDGKRTRITRDDSSDHVWEFHFTEEVSEYWKNLDPYWMGTGPPMRRYFHRDGSQTADPGDPVWGGHESCYYMVTSLLYDGKIREHYVRINRWPRMNVTRKQDWSWEMSNHIFCYTSIPDADKKGGTGPTYPILKETEDIKNSNSVTLSPSYV